MKRIYFHALFFCFSFFTGLQAGFTQSVTVTGPANLEVGIPGTFKAKFSNGGDTTIVGVEKYEWEAPLDRIGRLRRERYQRQD